MDKCPECQRPYITPARTNHEGLVNSTAQKIINSGQLISMQVTVSRTLREDVGVEVFEGQLRYPEINWDVHIRQQIDQMSLETATHPLGILTNTVDRVLFNLYDIAQRVHRKCWAESLTKEQKAIEKERKFQEEFMKDPKGHLLSLLQGNQDGRQDTDNDLGSLDVDPGN